MIGTWSEQLAWFSARSLTRLPRSFQKEPERRKACQDAQEEHHGQGVVPGVGIFAALFFSFFSILFRIKKEHSRPPFL
jgi:hypothetical protein